MPRQRVANELTRTSLWLALRPDQSFRSRVAAIAEPVAVILLATVVARLLSDVVGIVDANEYLFREEASPDFMRAARAEGLWHGLRYGLIIAIAVGIGSWRGRRTAASYGLILNRSASSQLIGIGVAIGLIGSLPLQLLHIIHAHVPLGTETDFWQLKARVQWDFEFWAYMAIGSFLVVPIVEEFTSRGYVLGRLREAFSPGAALLLMATFFALAHGQYHRPEILAVGQLLSLALLSLLFGLAVYRTGSLLSAITAHVIINVPLDLAWRYIALAISVAALFLLRREVAQWLTTLKTMMRQTDDWTAALASMAFIAIALLTLRTAPQLPYISLVVFTILAFIGLGVRSPWSAARH